MVDTSRLVDALAAQPQGNSAIRDRTRAALADYFSGFDQLRNALGAQLSTPEGAGEAAAYATPGIGQALSAWDTYNAAKQGDWRGAALSGAGLLPFVGGMTKAAKAMSIGDALASGKYLVRGARDGSFRLGNEGGLWATDNPELAKTFGDRLEIVPMPSKIHNSDYFSIGERAGIDPSEGVHASELTPEEWNTIREGLKQEGYDAVNFGSGHMDNANDFWLLRDNIDRIPGKLD